MYKILDLRAWNSPHRQPGHFDQHSQGPPYLFAFYPYFQILSKFFLFQGFQKMLVTLSWVNWLKYCRLSNFEVRKKHPKIINSTKALRQKNWLNIWKWDYLSPVRPQINFKGDENIWRTLYVVLLFCCCFARFSTYFFVRLI